MRDPADTKTPDLAGDLPKKSGRPAKYATAAERQAAYRQRRLAAGNPVPRESIAALKSRIRELEAQLTASSKAAPDTDTGTVAEIDTLRAQTVTLSDEIHALQQASYLQQSEMARLQAELRHQPKPSATTQSKFIIASYDQRYQAVLKMRWIEYGSDDQIKRLRINLKKAATAITELKHELPNERANSDATFVAEMAIALTHYDTALEKAVREASKVKAKKEAERDTRKQNDLQAAEAAIFGSDTSLETVRSWIDALITLDAEAGRAWMQETHRTQNALVGFSGSVYDLKRIRDKGDPLAMRRAVANEKLSLMPTGSRNESRDGTYWHAGWSDVVAWRSKVNR